jgi:hypothetical protein
MDMNLLIGYINERSTLRADHAFQCLHFGTASEDTLVAFRRYCHITKELKKAKITDRFVSHSTGQFVAIEGRTRSLGSPYPYNFPRWFRDKINPGFRFDEEYEPYWIIDKINEHMMKSGSTNDNHWAECIAAIFCLNVETVSLVSSQQPTIERTEFANGIPIRSIIESRSNVERYNFRELF